MFNHVTGHEYTGKNFTTLCMAGFEEGSEFVTFKQAIKLDGISGKDLKGIKKDATLVRFSSTERVEDENGKMTAKPVYFSVFSLDDVLARKVGS